MSSLYHASALTSLTPCLHSVLVYDHRYKKYLPEDATGTEHRFYTAEIRGARMLLFGQFVGHYYTAERLTSTAAVWRL